MMNPIFIMAIVAIAIVSARPQYDDEYEYQSAVAAVASPQTYYDNDSEEERGTRNVRRAENEAAAPTIQLGDLISAVEHTLVHSNHNLAIANATNTTSFNSTETSTVIALPITLPTAATTQSSLIDLSEAETTLATDESEAITTIPIDANIMIIQTINSTQISPADASTGEVHVQQQHITLFSAAAGIFPKLPSINLDAITSSTAEPTDKSDDSKSDETSSSEEEDDKCATHDSDDSSTESNGEPVKCVNSAKHHSGDTESNIQKVKKNGILQEKLAEVAADPVILTQGI